MAAIPNFDAMTQGELMAFWSRYHHPSRKDAAALIGDRRPGYTTLASTLASYACNKAVAIGCRLKGDLTAASIYEHSAELIYGRLPEDLRW